MAHFLERIIEDKPCHKCDRYDDCRVSGCIKWENWFSIVWHELQNLYLYKK